jgi:hypothetical protein
MKLQKRTRPAINLGMALLDYLSSRRAEVEAQIKALKTELADIRIAEAALTEGSAVRTTVARPGAAPVRAGSIKDWVLKALAQAPDIGLDTEDTITVVEMIGGPKVPRNSMTPQLSRLKADGLLVLEGRNWRLAPPGAAQKEETPDGETSGASEDEDYSDLV